MPTAAAAHTPSRPGRVSNVPCANPRWLHHFSLYTHAELVFNNIDNIHVQRASAQNLADLLLPGGHLDALSRDR